MNDTDEHHAAPPQPFFAELLVGRATMELGVSTIAVLSGI